jgi:hypothetical protein
MIAALMFESFLGGSSGIPPALRGAARPWGALRFPGAGAGRRVSPIDQTVIR